MKTLLPIIVVVTLTAFFPPGCVNSSTTTGTAATVSSDPVVAAETSLRLAKDTIDIFLHLEKDNQAIVKANAPQIHTFAEYLRAHAADILISANLVKNTYKHNRSADNAANLVTIMATVNQLVAQAAQYTTKLTTTSP
jgi:predicted ATPase